MNLLKSVVESISLGNLRGPCFIKQDSEADTQLQQLEVLLTKVPESMKSQISNDIKMLEYGIYGEETVAYELNNSHIPMLILHDLNLVFEGLSAQIDYLIITNKFVLVLECKNLFGNIEVNNNGDFIRTMSFFGKYKKEGIYSPITQNMRHCDLLRSIWCSSKENVILRKLAEKQFNNMYRSIVVLANPKTVINMKFAKKEVKDKIIRADQLINYIKRLLDQSDQLSLTKDEMLSRADLFMRYHKSVRTDYTKKYVIPEIEIAPKIVVPVPIVEKPKPVILPDPKPTIPVKEIIVPKIIVETNIEETEVYKALKNYRLDTSRIEGIKAYYIFSNSQLEDLIKSNPKNIFDLMKIKGFDKIKAEKYGNEILKILSEKN